MVDVCVALAQRRRVEASLGPGRVREIERQPQLVGNRAPSARRVRHQRALGAGGAHAIVRCGRWPHRDLAEGLDARTARARRVHLIAARGALRARRLETDDHHGDVVGALIVADRQLGETPGRELFGVPWKRGRGATGSVCGCMGVSREWGRGWGREWGQRVG